MSETKVFIGDKRVDGNNKILPFRPCMKKVVVHAVQMDVPFKVETDEGVMLGKSGDFLMKGAGGEYYPCDKKIFEKTYDFLLAKNVTVSHDGKKVFHSMAAAMKELTGG